MTAEEILNELHDGKVIQISSRDAFEFMREFERHALASTVIHMTWDGPIVTLRAADTQEVEGGKTTL